MSLSTELSISDKVFFFSLRHGFIYINIKILSIIPYMIRDQKEKEIAGQFQFCIYM